MSRVKIYYSKLEGEKVMIKIVKLCKRQQEGRKRNIFKIQDK